MIKGYLQSKGLRVQCDRVAKSIHIYLLKQHIKSPTRVTLNSQTLIEVGVVELGISDHNLVYICCKVSVL